MLILSSSTVRLLLLCKLPGSYRLAYDTPTILFLSMCCNPYSPPPPSCLSSPFPFPPSSWPLSPHVSPSPSTLLLPLIFLFLHFLPFSSFSLLPLPSLSFSSPLLISPCPYLPLLLFSLSSPSSPSSPSSSPPTSPSPCFPTHSSSSSCYSI